MPFSEMCHQTRETKFILSYVKFHDWLKVVVVPHLKHCSGQTHSSPRILVLRRLIVLYKLLYNDSDVTSIAGCVNFVAQRSIFVSEASHAALNATAKIQASPTQNLPDHHPLSQFLLELLMQAPYQVLVCKNSF